MILLTQHNGFGRDESVSKLTLRAPSPGPWFVIPLFGTVLLLPKRFDTGRVECNVVRKTPMLIGDRRLANMARHLSRAAAAMRLPPAANRRPITSSGDPIDSRLVNCLRGFTMAVQRVPLAETPEFRDLTPEPWDGVLIALLKPYVLLHRLIAGPFSMRRHFVTSRKADYRRLTTEQAEGLPAFVREYLARVEHEMSAVGFPDAVWHARLRHQPVRTEGGGNAVTIAPSVTGADLCVAGASDVPGRLRMSGATFFSRMVDGHLIATGNERRLVPSSRLAHYDVVTFADAIDVRSLHALHRRRVTAATIGGRVPVLVGWNAPATHPLAFLQRCADETIDDGLQRGRVVPPAIDDVRLTLKGAIAVSLNSNWQLSPIFDWHERLRARRVLRDLGS